MTTPDLAALRGEALRLLAASDPAGAYRTFRAAVEHPCALERSEDWALALGTLAELSRGLEAGQVAEKCAAAAEAPDDPERLYQAAYDLYEQSQYGVAASLLARANTLQPGQPKLVNELVSNLEALLRSAEAVAVLRASGVADRDPLSAYLLGFNALMAGDLGTPRTLLPGLLSAPNPQLVAMAQALEGMLARADAVRGAAPLDDRDLRGWHLVLNGSVLLHRSPHGFDTPMRGRYAYVCDSYGLIREGIDRARLALRAAGLDVACVTCPPGRSHEVLAGAVAALWGVSQVPWAERGARLPCLVAAYDLDALGDMQTMQALRDHVPGQVLWAHASCWTNPFPFSPDLTTFLHQSNTAPWAEGRLQVDPGTKQVVRAPADEAPVADLVRRVVEAPPLADSLLDTDALEALVRAALDAPEPHRPGLLRTSGPRLRQRAGSPVPSARFA